MKTWHCGYTLDPLQISPGVEYSNKGVLLKYEDDTYSLYHPIESLGDLPVENFLSLLKRGNDLTKKVEGLRCSEEDFKEFTSSKLKSYYSAPSFKSLFEKVEGIESFGFSSVKLKVSSLSEIEKNLVKLNEAPFQYIFDFNGREETKSFQDLSSGLISFLDKRVLYLEDPSKSAPNLAGVPLASDFISYDGQENLKVVKPTGFNHELSFVDRSKTVVTSYLDHPLGQMIAALWAVRKGITLDCGLHSHTYYSSNKYSELFTKDAFFDFHAAPQFFKQLRAEQWK